MPGPEISNRVRQCALGIVVGLLVLSTLGFAGYYAIQSWTADLEDLTGRRYNVAEPDSLARDRIANDAWWWEASSDIQPLGIQRVDYYEEETLFDGTPWGYCIYFKGRVRDESLKDRIRLVLKRGSLDAPNLPLWASHVPRWWSPSGRLPLEPFPELAHLSHDFYIDPVGDDLILYWVKDVHKGRLYSSE